MLRIRIEDSKEILEHLIKYKGDCIMKRVCDHYVHIICYFCPLDCSNKDFSSHPRKERVKIIYNEAIEKYIKQYGKAALMELLL